MEESYVARNVSKRMFSSFFMFSLFSSSKVCTCLSSTRNVLVHHGTSAKCLSCDFHFYFFVDAFKLRTYWFMLSYISCWLECLYIFLLDHAITYMGQPLSPTWANQYVNGCIGSINLRELAYVLIRLGVGVVFLLLFVS